MIKNKSKNAKPAETPKAAPKQTVATPVTPTIADIKTTVITKKDLIRLIAVETVHTPKDVKNILDSMFTIMGSNLAHGAKVAIMGFGTFMVRTRKARAGISPKTLAKITIDESTTVGFRAGSVLKKKVSNK